MFITDLDGTLFNEKRCIHPDDMEALELLGKQGIIRVFATGRSIYSFQKAMKHMGFSPTCSDMPVDYVIFSTGAGVMECAHGRVIASQSLSGTDVAFIAGYFDRLEIDYMVHKPVPDTRYFIYKVGKGNFIDASPDFRDRIAMYRDYGAPMTEKGINGFGAATEVLAIVPEPRGHLLADEIARELKEFSVIKATSPLDGASIWIEVFHPNVSKSAAAAKLAMNLEIEVKDVVAVGNDYNDLDLLAWAGKGFVVENAPDEIKRGFETVASHNACGVREAVFRGFAMEAVFQTQTMA